MNLRNLILESLDSSINIISPCFCRLSLNLILKCDELDLRIKAWMNEAMESIYEEYRPWYRPISTGSGVTTTDTEVVAADTERERESAYVSRKHMWRTPPEPSSKCTNQDYSDGSWLGRTTTEPLIKLLIVRWISSRIDAANYYKSKFDNRIGVRISRLAFPFPRRKDG